MDIFSEIAGARDAHELRDAVDKWKVHSNPTQDIGYIIMGIQDHLMGINNGIQYLHSLGLNQESVQYFNRLVEEMQSFAQSVEQSVSHHSEMIDRFSNDDLNIPSEQLRQMVVDRLRGIYG